MSFDIGRKACCKAKRVAVGYSSSGIQKPSYRRLQTVGRSVSGALCLKQVETDRSVSFDGIRPWDAVGEQRMCGFSEMERCCRKVPAVLNHLLSGPDSLPERTQILVLSTSEEQHICCDCPGVDWRKTRKQPLFLEGDAGEITPSSVIGSRAPPEHRALGGLARAILRVIDKVFR